MFWQPLPGLSVTRRIDNWCRSVWTAFGGNRQTIIGLLLEFQIT
jgi:hypothetical protein